MFEKLYINHDENIEFGIIGDNFGINVTDHCGDKSAWLSFEDDQAEEFLARVSLYMEAIREYRKTGNLPKVEPGTSTRPEPDPRIAKTAKQRFFLEKGNQIVKEEGKGTTFLFPLRFNASKFKQQKQARKAWDLEAGMLPIAEFEKQIFAFSDIVCENNFKKLNELTQSKNFGARFHPETIESLMRPEVTIKQLWAWYAYMFRFLDEDLSEMTESESKKIEQLSKEYFSGREYSKKERLEALENVLMKVSGESSDLIMHAAKIMENMVPNDTSFDFLVDRVFFLKEEEDLLLKGEKVPHRDRQFFIEDWKAILAFQRNDY